MLSLVVLSLLCPFLQPALAVTIDMEGLPDTGLDTSNWTTGVLPPLEDIWDLNDMQIAAKNVLSGKFYGQFDSFAPRISTLTVGTASYRTAALNEYSTLNRNTWIVSVNGYPTAYQANLGIYSKVKLNGFGFRDVSNLQTSYVAARAISTWC
jgi:hypothetical protein